MPSLNCAGTSPFSADVSRVCSAGDNGVTGFGACAATFVTTGTVGFVAAVAVFVDGAGFGRAGAFVVGFGACATTFVTTRALVFVGVATAVVGATTGAEPAGAFVAGLGGAAG